MNKSAAKSSAKKKRAPAAASEMPAKLADTSRRLPDPSALIHLAALAVTVVAVIYAPTVNQRHPAKELSSFFSSTAQIAVTLLVAVALFQGALDSRVAYRARRWLRPSTFVYLGAATVAGVIGSTAAVDPWLYRWLFGLSVGLGGAGLLSVLLVGGSNIGAQHDEEIAAAATALDQPAACVAPPSAETPPSAER